MFFQTDSLHQFLFKACPPSGVRGLFIDFFPICLCHSHSHLLISKVANLLIFPPARAARTVCPCGSYHPPVHLAPSFVFLRLYSASLYLRISLVFQTDSLHQFLFKACSPSGVRGLLTYLFLSACVAHTTRLCVSHPLLFFLGLIQLRSIFE